MKLSYVVILVAAAVVVTASVSFMIAPRLMGGKDQESLFAEDQMAQLQREQKSPEQAAEEMMKYLEEIDPERAKVMQQLRTKDPERFREIVRERASRRLREEGMSEPPLSPEDMTFGGRQGHKDRFRGRGRTERMQQRQAEYLEWLKINFPDEAAKLEEEKEKNPRLFPRRLALSFRKYGKIAENARDNPELGLVLKEKVQLNERRDELLRKIKSADEKRKKLMTDELILVLGLKYDLILKQKQIAYEQLTKRLTDLEGKVKESNDELEKRKDAEYKKESVNNRLEELLKGTESFKWD